MFWYASAVITKVLQVLLIGVMQKQGHYRRYPVVFAYSVFAFLAGIMEWATLLTFYSRSSPAYVTYYWSAEIGLQILLFAVMISLIYRALEGTPNRILLSFGMSALIIAVCLAAAYLSRNPAVRLTPWLTVVSRNLQFGAALLNVVLWWALLKNRGRDQQILMLAAGIGLLTTGKAIGHSLRVLDRSVQTFGNVVVVYSAILCFGIWLWTFRRLPVASRARVAAQPSPHL